MAQDNKKEISTDELLKKLLTSFGTDGSEEEEADQLTIEDTALEAKKGQRPKVFRINAKKEEETPLSHEDELKQDKEALEEQIRKAELFVAGMEERINREDEEDAVKSAEEIAEEDRTEPQGDVFEEKTEKEESEDPFDDLFLDFPDIEEGPHAKKERGSDPFEVKAQEQETHLEKREEQEDVLKSPTDQESGAQEENAQEEEAEDVFSIFDEEEGEDEDASSAVKEDEDASQMTPVSDEETEGELSDEEQPAEDVVAEEEGQQGAAEQDGEIDEKEIGIMMLFGDKKKLEDKVGKEELNLRLKKLLGDADAETVKEEYVSHDQEARFFKMLRGAYNRINIRAVFMALVFVAVLALEVVFPLLVTESRPLESIVGTGIAEIFANPVLTALLGLQVTFLIAAAAYKEFLTGVKAFFTGRSVPQMYFAVSVVFTVLYEIALLFCRNIQAPFYNLPVALTALFAVSFTGMRIARTILSYNVVATKRPKYTVTHLTENAANPEKEAFEQYLSENTGVFGVGKTDFVKSFAARSAREPRYKSIVMILATLCLVLGVVFFLLGYYFAPDNQLLSGLVMSLQAVLFSVPASAFVTYSLPFFRASKKAFARESAIIGEFSLEEYADATVISFDDKEVFPAKNVKVRSLKLYGDTRIDHVLFGAASVFHRIGGPLDDVFGVATRESGYSDNVDVLEAVSGGVEAAVDGELVRVGNSAFMRAKGLLSSVDPDDAAMEMEGQVSVMYMSIGSKLAAKMYVSYGADEEIEEIMAALYKAGMCIGIRTLDPNIDDRMISTHVVLSGYPVKVLRMDRKERELYAPEMESGVVSKKDVKSLLKTLTYCRKVLQVVRVGTVIKIIGVVLGVAASVLLLFLSATGRIAGVYEVSSLWIALYQLCLMLPTLIVSILFV